MAKQTKSLRIDGRKFNDLRSVKITPDYLRGPQGSVLIEMGNTKVIASAFFESGVPRFLKGQNKGWITAEYGMIPGSSAQRIKRDVAKGRMSGRTVEIQRLIGRSLRAVVDLEALGENTILLDCDVIQADGGTRTASITGSFIALMLALYKKKKDGKIDKIPIKDYMAAVSVGVVAGAPMLDLCYTEDFKATVDMNVVMTQTGRFVEIQGTGEESTFDYAELEKLLVLAKRGITKLIALQKEVIKRYNN